MFIDYYFTRLKRFTRASDFCSQHGAMIDRVIVLSCGWLRLALSFQLERRGREILKQTICESEEVSWFPSNVY